MLTALAILSVAAIAFAIYIDAMRKRDLDAMTDAELCSRAKEAGDTDLSYQQELDYRRAELFLGRTPWEKS